MVVRGSQLRQAHTVPGQKVAALHAGGIGDVRTSSHQRFGIAEQIGAVSADPGQRSARSHRDRGQVERDQTSVAAPRNTRAGHGRVGIVAHEDALALAGRHDEVGARVQRPAIGDEYTRGVPTPRLAGVGDAKLGVA